MARAIDKRIMLDLIIEAKKTDPETGPFSEWLAEYLVDHLPTLTPPNEWVSVEDRMPKYNIREDGELVSSKILVRCEIDKTVHLVVSKKFYTGRPGEMVHPVFRFYDEWGDIIENVSHWMPLPEPPTDLEKRMGEGLSKYKVG